MLQFLLLLDQCVCSHQKHYWQTLFCLKEFISHNIPYDGDIIGLRARSTMSKLRPRKDRRKDRLDKDWTRKASSSDRLAGSRFILQNTSWQDVAVWHLHVSCNVAWLRCTFLCNVALCDYLKKVSRHLQSLFYLLDCVKDN